MNYENVPIYETVVITLSKTGVDKIENYYARAIAIGAEKELHSDSQ